MPPLPGKQEFVADPFLLPFFLSKHLSPSHANLVFEPKKGTGMFLYVYRPSMLEALLPEAVPFGNLRI